VTTPLVRTLWLPVVLALLLAAVWTAPAAAHARLVASTPGDGATLDEPPGEVVLEFNEMVEADFGQLQVSGPDGERLDASAPIGEGTTVRSPLLEPTASGTYTVAYRVVSADGHPVEGSFTFELTEAAVTEDTAEIDPPPSPAPDDGTGSTPAEGPAGSTPTEEPTDPDGSSEDEPAELAGAELDERGGLPWLPIAVIAVIVLAVAAVVLSRRGDATEAHPDHDGGIDR
jgi:copper resistance protein C